MDPSDYYKEQIKRLLAWANENNIDPDRITVNVCQEYMSQTVPDVNKLEVLGLYFSYTEHRERIDKQARLN